MGAFFLSLAVVFNVVANSLFKVSSGIPEWTLRKGWILALGLFIGLANTLSFVKSLERLQLGVAYPAFSAASIVLIALVSLVVFREGITPRQWLGLGTLCVGMLLLWK